MAHVEHNSGNNEWYTPSYIVEAARRVLGAFDCDPASSDFANTLIGAKTYYTEQTNGLDRSHPWGSRVWMNPPYGRALMGNFCEELCWRVTIGEVREACVITNNATETKWAQTLFSISSAQCFLSSRVAFLDRMGRVANKPLQGQVIWYVGDKIERFAREFHPLGFVTQTRRDGPDPFDE